MTSTITSAPRSFSLRPPIARAPSRSPCTSDVAVRAIGARPKASAVTTVRTAAKPSTRRSRPGVADGRKVGRHHAPEQRQDEDGEPDAERAAEPGEDEALGGELADQPLAPRAHRGADRQFLPPSERAREQQVGQVGADDQEHAQRRAAQREDHDPRLLRELEAEGVDGDVDAFVLLGILLPRAGGDRRSSPCARTRSSRRASAGRCHRDSCCRDRRSRPDRRSRGTRTPSSASES